MDRVRLSLLSLMMVFSPSLWAETQVVEVSLEPASGAELSIEQLGNGQDRILWIPSEFSRHSQDERLLLEGIAAGGDQVWWLDLHSSFFIPPGRNSYDEIPIGELADLIEKSRPHNGRLTLMATGRGARVALEIARLWQLKHPKSDHLSGVVLFHPNLAAGIAQAGADVTLYPIAFGSNLPIYIFQPADSSKRWYLSQLADALAQGGSDVLIQLIKGVTDGFHLRDDVTDFERWKRKDLPEMIRRAKGLMSVYNEKPRVAVKELKQEAVEQKGKLEGGLQPIMNAPAAPPLQLTDIDGEQHDLSAYRGRKVLINFWTTWCPPCVKEIPSLGRLQRNIDREELVVLSVDVGETKEQVAGFLDKIPADFPVMLDSAGSTVKSWKIRAFPTTYLVDAQGRLRYGYYGGLEWDEPDVVALIRGMK